MWEANRNRDGSSLDSEAAAAPHQKPLPSMAELDSESDKLHYAVQL